MSCCSVVCFDMAYHICFSLRAAVIHVHPAKRGIAKRGDRQERTSERLAGDFYGPFLY